MFKAAVNAVKHTIPSKYAAPPPACNSQAAYLKVQPAKEDPEKVKSLEEEGAVRKPRPGSIIYCDTKELVRRPKPRGMLRSAAKASPQQMPTKATRSSNAVGGNEDNMRMQEATKADSAVSRDKRPRTRSRSKQRQPRTSARSSQKRASRSRSRRKSRSRHRRRRRSNS